MTERSPNPAGDDVDQTALAELYGHYRTELLALVRRIVGNGPPEPEDIVQQTFLNFAAQPAAALTSPRAYLHRTAHNLAINAAKRERIGRRFFEAVPKPEEIEEARTDWDPQIVLMDKEAFHIVENVIRAMPRQRRQFFILNRVDGLSYAEIGRRLGVSEGMVRKHVALAVRECGAALLAATQPGRTPDV